MGKDGQKKQSEQALNHISRQVWFPYLLFAIVLLLFLSLLVSVLFTGHAKLFGLELGRTPSHFPVAPDGQVDEQGVLPLSSVTPPSVEGDYAELRRRYESLSKEHAELMSQYISIEAIPASFGMSKQEIINKLHRIDAQRLESDYVNSLLVVFEAFCRKRRIDVSRADPFMCKHILNLLSSLDAWQGKPTDDASTAHDAIVQFQRDNELDADGVIGEKTLIKLLEKIY